jgi:hypothetical protein
MRPSGTQLSFPYNGLHQGFAAEDQPANTTPSCQNVRPVDVSGERIRGGQRPGITKAYAEVIETNGTPHPVILIGSITVTYIPAGA